MSDAYKPNETRGEDIAQSFVAKGRAHWEPPLTPGTLGGLRQVVPTDKSLLEDLKSRREAIEWQIANLNGLVKQREDLDRAIAALSPAPVEAEPDAPGSVETTELAPGIARHTVGDKTVFSFGGYTEESVRDAAQTDVKYGADEPAAGDDPERLDGGHGMPASATFEDYPDFTPEQTAAIESATADFQFTNGAQIVSGEPWSQAPKPDAELNSGPFENDGEPVGEGETGLDPWSLGHKAGFSAHDPDPTKGDRWLDGYAIGARDRVQSIKLGEPVPNYDGTHPEPPEPSDYFPTQPLTISASKPHADESDAQMFAAGINRELEKA